MHRRVVKAIELALTQNEVDGCVSFEKYKESAPLLGKGGGFWVLKVKVTQGNSFMIPLIERVGLSIGRFYGEGLYVEKTKFSIRFS